MMSSHRRTKTLPADELIDALRTTEVAAATMKARLPRWQFSEPTSWNRIATDVLWQTPVTRKRAFQNPLIPTRWRCGAGTGGTVAVDSTRSANCISA